MRRWDAIASATPIAPTITIAASVSMNAVCAPGSSSEETDTALKPAAAAAVTNAIERAEWASPIATG